MIGSLENLVLDYGITNRADLLAVTVLGAGCGLFVNDRLMTRCLCNLVLDNGVTNRTCFFIIAVLGAGCVLLVNNRLVTGSFDYGFAYNLTAIVTDNTIIAVLGTGGVLVLILNILVIRFRNRYSFCLLVARGTIYRNIAVLLTGRLNDYLGNCMRLLSNDLSLSDLAALRTIYNLFTRIFTGGSSYFDPFAGSYMSMLRRNLICNADNGCNILAVIAAEIARVNRDAYIGKLDSCGRGLAVSNFSNIHRSRKLNGVDKRKLSAFDI